RNTVLTWRERQRGANVVPFSALERDDGSSVIDEVASLDEDPEATLLRVEGAATVDQLIARLPAGYREVLVLRELEELSYREIASVTGVPTGTVMSRLSRARQMLLAALPIEELRP
ncbi:MAG: sigma-70 family RNA polymerase sigma factor, partial [Phenylobacterium sp.]